MPKPMVDLSKMTVSEAIASLRDLFFVISLTVIGWRARSWLQPVYDFFTRANKHMDLVEAGMATLLSNHLKHMEEDLRVLAKREITKVQQVEPLAVVQTHPVEVVQTGKKPIWIVQIDPDDLPKT